jgi:L-asparaginase
MKSKVLIIYTGGTIGMKQSQQGYEPDILFPDKIKADIGSIKDPQIPEFEIISMSPLLDSSNMNPDNWDKITEVIDNAHKDYKAFIILHGTDTMAYTASALGFMLSGINNTVIITGSQVPYNRLRNDARENIISSLIIAGNFNIPEVVLYFNNKLLRGCRSTKIDASSFDAFDSPNYPALADIGVDINIKRQWSYSIQLKSDLLQQTLKKTKPIEYFHHNQVKGANEIGVLKLFPGISARYVETLLTPEIKAVVIEAYGAGNGPGKAQNPALFNALKNASKHTVLVAVSQCLKGTVQLNTYAASLKEAGVISGYDMTLEAALTKLYYLISKQNYNLDKVRELFTQNLIGEVTID